MCPIAQPISRSITRGLRAPIAAAWRKHSETEASAASVSTSAFGEGVNLPDIRHVVLYHMPFGAIEFNQMSGRAGRDGQPAVIHLLYSSRDARINERLLDCYAPERDELVTLYRALQTMWRSNRGKTGDDSFCASDIDIAQMCLYHRCPHPRSTSVRWQAAWESSKSLVSAAFRGLATRAAS